VRPGVEGGGEGWRARHAAFAPRGCRARAAARSRRARAPGGVRAAVCGAVNARPARRRARWPHRPAARPRPLCMRGPRAAVAAAATASIALMAAAAARSAPGPAADAVAADAPTPAHLPPLPHADPGPCGVAPALRGTVTAAQTGDALSLTLTLPARAAPGRGAPWPVIWLGSGFQARGRGRGGRGEGAEFRARAVARPRPGPAGGGGGAGRLFSLPLRPPPPPPRRPRPFLPPPPPPPPHPHGATSGNPRTGNTWWMSPGASTCRPGARLRNQPAISLDFTTVVAF